MSRVRFRWWRGVKALVHDAVDATVELVREGHETTARVVRRVTDEIEPLSEPVRMADDVRRVGTAGVLGTIKLVNRAVENVTDLGFHIAEHTMDAPDPAEVISAMPMRSDVTGTAWWVGDAALGLVNAAVGDHLGERANGLDLSMLFRVNDRYVAPEPKALTASLSAPSSRVALFVHGLGTTEWSWCLEAAEYHGDPTINFGTLIERDLQFTPVFLRYNAGRHVSENGRELAAQLERFVAAYPTPITDLTLIGHSMGGLVIRSACHYGLESKHGWVGHTRRVFCLGSPHQGAPLAKLTHVVGRVLGAIDLPGTRIGARIVEGRSAGIKDLRHGSLIDEDWLDVDVAGLAKTTPNVPGAQHYFISATITDDPDHPVGQLLGDLLVRMSSSSGPTSSELVVEERHVPIVTTSHHGGVFHHQLQNHPAVYEQIRRACADETGRDG